MTTLFPPVRPRGRYLEVRFPDVQEDDAIGTLVAALAALLYDDTCRAEALRRVAGRSPGSSDTGTTRLTVAPTSPTAAASSSR